MENYKLQITLLCHEIRKKAFKNSSEIIEKIVIAILKSKILLIFVNQ